MDLQRRRRSPEGMSAAGEFLALPDREESAEHTGQLSVAGAASEETPVVANTGVGSGESATVESNPFWSERMQSEAHLRAMRPQALADAERSNSAAESASTELRPETAAATEVQNQAGENVGADQVEGSGTGSFAASASGYGNRATATEPLSQGQSSERLGMRPGERLVMEQMKSLLEDLYEQNRVLLEIQKPLQDRLNRVENDAMQSATSGGEREAPDQDQRDSLREFVEWGKGGWNSESSVYLGRFVPPEERQSLDYHAGIEEGIRRATEALKPQGNSHINRAPSPPPPPPRDEPPTTPNGTRVPLGTPPRTPTPIFGSPVDAQPPTLQNQVRHPLAQSVEWSAATTQPPADVTDFWGRVGIRSSSAAGSFGLGQTIPSTKGLVGGSGESRGSLGPMASSDRRLGVSGQVPSGGLFAGCVSGLESAGSGGGGSGSGNFGQGQGSSRGDYKAFTHGDRTWWKLPPLPDPSIEDACIAVSDWLTQIQPIMSDLSDRSGAWSWWQRIMTVAQQAYIRWQQAGPLEKSLVVCDTPTDLMDPRLSRLEARALGMIMASLPTRIKDELVVTKALTSTNALFRILLAFQPGGLAERQKLIANLQEPGAATNARHCSDQLRRWHRWLSRAHDLGVSPPDPAILLAGLDKLCLGVIASNAQLGFRCNISRTQHQLDFNPNVSSVTAYARLLQAEMETLALSSSDPTLEEPKLTKKQRAAAL